LAGLPKELIGNPADLTVGGAVDDDVLSDVLRNVRLSGSLQFCFMPTGAWQTDATPSLANSAQAGSSVIPFHIVVEGSCWLKMDGRDVVLGTGDVVAFPFGTGHQLGAGADGRLILPGRDLPPKPWREIPVLRYGEARQRVRLLCGYLQCNAISFRPLRDALPTMLHVRTRETQDAAWLRAAIAQIVSEVDHPRAGGLSMLERLTEITFIELLRYQMIAASAGPGSGGWLAALADPALARCFALIHSDPKGAQSMKHLAAAAGLSRSTLSERFEAMLGTSPMRYVRDWRLCLASVALSTTRKGIAAIADEAGYGTEAAFNRAFARAYGAPPATWRQRARQGV
jgi:AraC-like DNA-binding protein/mannose-6-phosphate isomerase-like protein (cupin superfamily)